MQELFQCCVTTNSCYDGTTKTHGLIKLSKARSLFTILATAASKCVLLLGLDKINTSTRNEAEEQREIERFCLH